MIHKEIKPDSATIALALNPNILTNIRMYARITEQIDREPADLNAQFYESGVVVGPRISAPSVDGPERKLETTQQKNYEVARSLLHESDEVILHCDPGGIGDSVVTTQVGFELARQLGKPARIITHDRLVSMSMLDRPQGVKLLGGSGRKDELGDKGKKIVTVYFNIDGSIYFVPGSESQQTIYSGRDTERSAADLYGDNSPNNVVYRVTEKLRAVGYDIDPLQLHPIVDVGHAHVPAQPQFDLLIAPDAAEGKIERNVFSRSFKMLSAQRWSEVLTHMSQRGFNGRIGVINGHAHVFYSNYIYALLRSTGLQVESVSTRDLDAFAQAVLNSRKFVGMDSGTTHLALQVISAAKRQFNHQVSFRQVFNGQFVSHEDYKVTTPDQVDGKALVYDGLPSKLPSLDSRTDLSRLPANVVGDFILS